MSAFDNLIFDRTQADVEEVAALKAKYYNGTITNAEKNKYLAGLRGAYNYTDLNRVGNAVADIRDLMAKFGITVDVTPKTNWTGSYVVTQAQAAQYLADIKAIKDASAIRTESVPSTLDYLTIEMANRIEEILYTIGSGYEVSQQGKQRLSFKLGTKRFGV